MTAQPYDFRRPTRLPAAVQQLGERWLLAACTLVTKRAVAAGLKPSHNTPVEYTLQGLDTSRFRDVLAALPDTAIAYLLRGPRPDWVGLLIWPRPLLLALGEGLTGVLPDKLPEERALTVVELSLADYLVQELFLGPLRDTWPGQELPSLEVGPRDLGVKWSRFFPAERVLAESVLIVRGPFGEQTCRLLLPPEALPGAEAQGEGPSAAELRERLEGLVRTVPVDVTVTLGRAELPLSQLGKLKVDDVIVLGQRVRDPLVVAVAGRDKFQAWPGRVGSHQACQIASYLDR
jgi:flagellar motor switch protein FliM